MIHYIIFLIALVLFVLYKKKYVYYIFPISFLFDITLGFVEITQLTNIVQPLLFLIIILIFAKKEMFKKSPILLFIIYILILLIIYLLNVEIRLSAIKFFLVIFICYFMYFVGYYSAKNFGGYLKIIKSTKIIMCIAILYTILAFLFNLEDYLLINYQYSETLAALGTLGAQSLHVLSFSIILLFIHLFFFKKKPRIFEFLILVFSILIVIIVFRRTAIIIFLTGIMLFLINVKLKIKSWVKIIFIFVPILALFIYINISSLEQQYNVRKYKMANIERILQEGRILEYRYFVTHISNAELSKILFGSGTFFETRDFGRDYMGRERPIHTDYIFILYSTGILGLFLFLNIYIFIFNKIKKTKVIKQKKEKYLKNIALILLITNFVIMFGGGGFRHLTYVAFLMFTIGAFQRIIEISAFNHSENLQKAKTNLK